MVQSGNFQVGSLVAIATTPRCAYRLFPLTESLGVELVISPSCAQALSGDSSLVYTVYPGTLSEFLPTLWSKHQGLIFGLALGAVVRLIAPLLNDKTTDPAVVVVDETGNHAISVCGGHQGGADRLTRLIATQLAAVPIVTGACDSLNLPAIDTLGLPFGWNRGSGDWTGVSAAIAQQHSIQVIQDAGSTLWQQHLPNDHPFEFELDSSSAQARVWISATQRQFTAKGTFPKVQWHPRVLWVGIGCERGTDERVISQALEQVLAAAHLAEGAIAGIATLDRKADELGLLALCETKGWPLIPYTSQALQEVSVPNPSALVAETVGTPSVAEAAALTAAGVSQLLVSKQIYRFPDLSGAVTVAIAQSPQEYTARTGQLWLVGMGPGELQQMTPAAQTAVTQTDAVLGYGLYLDLIVPLRRPGQIIESFPLTQERQRAERAIELAQWGLTVAMISSGDCGIYGMAGLVLEELQNQGWDGKSPGVQVFPGITALQAAAARVGAPLMHDFCAISLSDLLTPWPTIEKRLVAAAQGDFVTAIYNPKSQKRTEGIRRSQEIFLQYRHPQTPVALVRCAYRENEEITLTTLAEFAQLDIDMLTTVLIGNPTTRTQGQWMITPRGYFP
ncbi:MAG: precorrin-3B C(17)-methyltransferase [Roseofilum sp. SBFL]|uniref:precorrin-3B C(17)-methyltransferase n=1 Tax=unclassified Roseofilum TaxID=2620099 RepID=UPI001B13551A|nr:MULTISPECIES: precorrin-3B C(17)-methyltransferase [unclassified Roseofilum]MBP0013751.1 precorrin-3B C(17)-methyltransferase [Roseofilum sp. SID3]MBP0026203.1 precorrin-3B C(17)-methyltransferase [Roseofilum sp. SID2]MBP0040623.1 precorrin-3B C(17)-methyltransferase [Roseofilum sp. SBFL]